jgi:N-carbamoyl-L-amino-acid hydrolase
MDLHVNPARLWESIEILAEEGATPEGGVCRLALSDADKLGRDRVVKCMSELGLQVQIDRVGNLLGLRPGMEDLPPLLFGSHVDTVNTGGRFDGAYGVLSALEVLRVLEENRVATRRPLMMAAFTNEEGARYTTDMMGSQAFCGELSVEEIYAIRGLDGSLVGEELQRIGYAGDFPCGGIRPHAYLELHIEQGPVLEREDVTIGVVEAITGLSWQEVTVRGRASHAGTTPMDSRADAALAAARILAALPGLAAGIPGQKATCGIFGLKPGAVNVIPHEALFTVDLRNTDEARLQDSERMLAGLVQQTASAAGCTAEVRTLGHVPPAACDPQVLRRIEAAAGELGHSWRRMTSGAGHDAQILSRICPTGMIFIPSRDGLSHSPYEYSSPEDVAAGADVLLRSVLALSD